MGIPHYYNHINASHHFIFSCLLNSGGYCLPNLFMYNYTIVKLCNQPLTPLLCICYHGSESFIILRHVVLYIFELSYLQCYAHFYNTMFSNYNFMFWVFPEVFLPGFYLRFFLWGGGYLCYNTSLNLFF